jgi:hypothetical protein
MRCRWHDSVMPSEPSVRRAVPQLARHLAAQLAELFARDVQLAERLNDAQERLRRANDRLWRGLHPDGLATVYGEHPAAIDVAFAENRSEVLGDEDPLRAIQQVHWTIHRAATEYQAVAEERRQLAADVGELTREFVDTLTAAGWTERDARTVDIRALSGGDSA